MMNTIGKEVAKKIKSDMSNRKRRNRNNMDSQRTFQRDTKFLHSCVEATHTLHELNIYINSYKRDSDYKASVRKICEQIRNMRNTDGLESDYGQLIFESKMKFKRENETKFEENCYIMCFHSRILVFEIEEPEGAGGGGTFLKRETK